MKLSKIIFYLFLITFIGCSHLDIEKLNFTKKIIDNPDSINCIVSKSEYFCPKSQYTIYNYKEYIKFIKSSKLEYYDYDSFILGEESIVNGKVIYTKHDSSYVIVYKDINVKDSYISFIFSKYHENWCFSSIVLDNIIEEHVLP